MFEGQCEPRFKKRFTNNCPSNAPIPDKENISNPKPQGGNRVALMLKELIVQNLVRSMKGNILSIWLCAMHVEKVDTN